MKRTITWIRHGQSTWNALGKWQGHTDTPLSELGKAQARALAERLKDSAFDAVYSSDLERARETCRLALPTADMQIDERLREINFGIFEGCTWTSLSEEQAGAVERWWVEPYAEKLEAGESMTCLNDRVNEFLSELPESCNIAIFAHGGVIRNAIWQVVGPPSKASWSVQIANTSMTVLEYTPKKVLVHKINDSAHLEGLATPDEHL